MISKQLPVHTASHTPQPLAFQTRAARISLPAQPARPCTWLISLGSPTAQQRELLKHYQERLEALGYSVGHIDAGSDAATVVELMQENFKNDQVVVLNTDASAEMLGAVAGEIRRRPNSLKQIGSSDGAPIDAQDLMAWRALDGQETCPVTNPTTAAPWSLAELESAMRQLSSTGALGSTPPRGSGIPDDLDIVLKRHEAVAQAINRMSLAGLLVNVSTDLALRLEVFYVALASKRAAANRRSDQSSNISG